MGVIWEEEVDPEVAAFVGVVDNAALKTQGLLSIHLRVSPILRVGFKSLNVLRQQAAIPN